MSKRAKIQIAVVVFVCVAFFSIAIWAFFFRKTEFSKEIWDRGPGWSRWRMREDVVRRIENDWVSKYTTDQMLDSEYAGKDLYRLVKPFWSIEECYEIYAVFETPEKGTNATVIYKP